MFLPAASVTNTDDLFTCIFSSGERVTCPLVTSRDTNVLSSVHYREWTHEGQPHSSLQSGGQREEDVLMIGGCNIVSLFYLLLTHRRMILMKPVLKCL